MELLICPFCGDKPNLTQQEDFVICNCGVGVSVFKWNTRPSPWISVSDKLPETTCGTSSSELLIVCKPCWVNNSFVKEGYYIKQKNGKERWKSSNGMQFLKEEVTHWMPLPNPTKGNKIMSEWTSVKNVLPLYKQVVLALLDNGIITEAVYRGEYEKNIHIFRLQLTQEETSERVKYWAPIPTLPKEYE